MKMNELLEGIRNKDFNLEEALQVKKYLPIEVKKTIAQGIIYECTNDADGVIKLDSVQKYLSYVRYMITTHTTLEYDDTAYDVLCSTQYQNSNLLNIIMGYFWTDAEECLKILNLMLDDYLQDTKLEYVVAKFLYGLNGVLGNVVDVINQKVENFDMQSMIDQVVNGHLDNLLK